MTKNNSVIEYKNYGKIKVNLSEIMNKKGINRYVLSKLTGIRFEVITKWYNNRRFRCIG